MKATCEQCNKAFQSNDPVELAALIGEHMQAHLEEQKPPPPPEPPGEWKEKSASFATFDKEGEEVIGILKSLDTIKMHDKEIRRATVFTPEGNRSFLLTTQLEPLLLDIPLGTTVRIRYEGEVKSSAGRTVKQFRVWTK